MATQSTKVFLVILSLAVIGTIIYGLYTFYSGEKVVGEEIIYHNLFLRVFNNQTGQQERVGYAVYFPDENRVFVNGTTLDNAFVRISIPENKSYYLITYNNNKFYSATYNEEGRNAIFRDSEVNLYLHQYGSLEIVQKESFRLTNKVTLKVNVINYFPPSQVCLRWGPHIISANVEGLSRITPDDRYLNKVDRCYDYVTFPNNLTVSYDYFGVLDETDFIKVYVIDSDIRSFSLPNRVVTDLEGNDLGREDIIYDLY